MTKVGLISDTHSLISRQFLKFFKDVDVILHAGDIGNKDVLEVLKKTAKVKAVYGNIDGGELRNELSENLVFNIEDVKIFMTHIGGYPGKYEKKVREMIERTRPQIFISGHSHILKVIFDKKYDLLHLNPGAAGNFGYHKVATALKFRIDKSKIQDMEILEVDRSKLKTVLNSHFIS
jgi:putative phosphoesterase